MNPDVLSMGMGYYDDDDDTASGYGGDGGDAMGFNLASMLQSALRGGGRRRPAPARPQYAQPPQPRRTINPFGGRGAAPQIGSAYNAYANLLSLPPGGAGMQNPGVRETTIGTTPVTFNTATTSNTMTFTVYKRFKPLRLIMNQAITGAPGVLVVATAAMIADRNQLGGSGQVEVTAAFSPTATFSAINWDIIDPATPLVITMVTTAAAAAMTSIVQSAVLYGVNLN